VTAATQFIRTKERKPLKERKIFKIGALAAVCCYRVEFARGREVIGASGTKVMLGKIKLLRISTLYDGF